jgi:thiamine-monophosphate kinase
VPLPEKSLITQIRQLAAFGSSARPSPQRKSVITGIGDDCAILRFSESSRKKLDTLVTTDFSIEGIHFRRDWHPPESVGHRCLARGLSDIAAMGGDPVAAFLSLAVPRDVPQLWIKRFLRGLLSLAKKNGVTLAGGDTAESPTGILADIVVVGSVPQGQAVLRSRAHPGDRLYVTGELGGSAAALKEMTKKNRKLSPRDYPRHFFPEPRIELGRILREEHIATSMIDTSDGLSTDLTHICEESAVGAELQANAIPRAKLGKAGREVGLEVALHGGEDYELLFTAPASKKVPSRLAGVPITHIGTVTRSRRIFLMNSSGAASPLKPQGWEHFR